MQKLNLMVFLLFIAVGLSGQNKSVGKITGIIVEKSTGQPVEYASIQLFKTSDQTPVEGTVSDTKGNFSIGNVALGDYNLAVSFMGFEKLELPNIRLTKENPLLNLGKLSLESSLVAVEEVVVEGKRSTYTQTIDKKIFSVGDDLTSSSGSVSDLMQNIPSLQVDMEGNVSLRGSENVQILINGKPSAMMGKNRAMVLQQLPANSIERIEIITNPSAKFKPDGTAGIINLILKKERKEGVNGTLAGNVGNKNRFNSSMALNYHKGGLNLYGSYGIRLDRRDRLSKDNRIETDSLTGDKSYLFQSIDSKARPTSNIAQAGIEWEINDKNSVEASANFNHMSFLREETTLTQKTDKNQLLTSNYDRFRHDDEFEREIEMAVKYTRKIGEDQEFSIDYTHNNQKEQEDNKFTNKYLIPVSPDSKDNTLISQANSENLLRINYLRPSGKDAELELGYELEADKSDLNFYAENLLGSTWVKDNGKSNQFLFDETVHAFYATDKQTFGKFGVMAGLRAEQSLITSHLVTIDSIVPNNYFSIYPTLHTSYNFSEASQWQLNYSKRINRPEGDDLNPFPEYRDPYNISAGNPKLKPEQIHSVETGYLFHKGANTFSATIYYRNTYNKLTEITKLIKNNTVLLTTKENLASSSSTGVEAIVNRAFSKVATVNLNFNGYFNTLDASNLGYSGSKTAFSWNTALNTNFNITKLLMMQVNTRYASAIQTPQGERQPTFIVNIGARYEVFKRKASLLLTVSDLFDSFRNRTIIDMPGLHRETESRRAPRIVYLGFVYHFGSASKNSKETQLKFEE
jgi:outer membrane receptor protein involved in Fe transport